MPPKFDRYEQRVSRHIDDLYGACTLVTWFNDGRHFAGTEDATRKPVTAVGIRDENPTTVGALDEGQYDGVQPTLAGSKIHYSFDLDQFPDHQPEEGCTIKDLSYPDNPTYKVKRVDPDGVGRIVCVCTSA